ncbi:glycosyltransferase family 2 protein [Caldalkalibacillus salinus]|uniref:glycosyltransferase family 2 protein n=1 Tax=Caldalkalibacillus salinus TaxID=2803787 RepID=UPI0019207C29|nr:glycosyltransferase family 2 protein [Caldalkalibacillus salinus]
MHIKDHVSVVIPAYNEEAHIGQTLSVLQDQKWVKELIVVDDGSSDLTHYIAEKYTAHVLSLPRNVGKAEALKRGSLYARYPILLFLDADLRETAKHAKALVQPLWKGQAHMTTAVFPPTSSNGFGLIRRFAQWQIKKKTGVSLQSPLCGQRAIYREVFHSIYRGDQHFGVEVGLTLDCLKGGYNVQEVEVPFEHRELGKTWRGMRHRLKQGMFVCQAIYARK